MQVDIRKIGCHIASDFSITLYQTNSLFAFVFFFPQEYLTLWNGKYSTLPSHKSPNLFTLTSRQHEKPQLKDACCKHDDRQLLPDFTTFNRTFLLCRLNSKTYVGEVVLTHNSDLATPIIG